MNKMCVVGLTGPTGSGKSTVVRQWKKHGFSVIDTDGLARQIVEPGSDCLAALVAAFSEKILRDDGTLDRACLAQIAFADKENEQRLNSITHPAIIALAKEQLKAEQDNGTAVTVIDAPLLIESGMNALCDYTVAVIADRKLRRDRIMQRDHISEEQALLRIRAQQQDVFYTKQCTKTIHNNADVRCLEKVSDMLAEDILRWRCEK